MILALTRFRELSMLEDEFDRLNDDVWFVEMLAFTLLSDRSTLDEEFERLKLDV